MPPIDRVEAVAAIKVDEKPVTVNAVEVNTIGVSIGERTDRMAHSERAEATKSAAQAAAERALADGPEAQRPSLSKVPLGRCHAEAKWPVG